MSRLPIIRHIRWAYYYMRIIQWYSVWREFGYLPMNIERDKAVLDAIWRGEM